MSARSKSETDLRFSPQVDLIVGHLNAPYGTVVTAEDVAAALSQGRIDAVVNPEGRALVASMFIECAPHSIAAAALEVGAGLENVASLYRSCVESGEARSSAWEGAMGELVDSPPPP